MKKKLYLANPYGFSKQSKKLLNEFINIFKELNVEVYEPFERTKHIIQKEGEWAYDLAQSNFDDLIIANGPSLEEILSGLKISKGQLVGLKGEQSIDLDLPLNSAGYILPKVKNITWIGSSHEKEYENLNICYDIGKKLVKRIDKNFKIKLAGTSNMLMEARLRTGSKDRLPLAGKIEENVYALGALGSRGFSLGPMLGEYIASLINNSPSPISAGIALAIEPLRFKD